MVAEHFSEEQVRTIAALLTSSVMTLAEIAEHMKCSKSAVVAINRRFRIRNDEQTPGRPPLQKLTRTTF